MFLFIGEAEDDRVVFDQQVQDDQVVVLCLGDQFLLEAVENINPDHFLGGEVWECERGVHTRVIFNCDAICP